MYISTPLLLGEAFSGQLLYSPAENLTIRGKVCVVSSRYTVTACIPRARTFRLLSYDRKEATLTVTVYRDLLKEFPIDWWQAPLQQCNIIRHLSANEGLVDWGGETLLYDGNGECTFVIEMFTRTPKPNSMSPLQMLGG